MNTLTLIETSLSPQCELTAEAWLILQRATVLICDSGTHAAYLKQITERCLTMEIERFDSGIQSVHPHIPTLDAETQHIVILWNQDTCQTNALKWMKSSSAQARFGVKATSQIDSRVQRLTGLPIEQPSNRTAGHIFIQATEWTEHLQHTLSQCSMLPSTLIFFGETLDVKQLAQQLCNDKLMQNAHATHISFGAPSTIQSYQTKDLINAHSLMINSGDLLIIGGRLDTAVFNDWCATRPLLGRRLMLTRSVGQQQVLHEHLTRLGALTAPVSVQELKPLYEQANEQMYGALDQYDWLIFTSVNAVRFFFEGLEQSPAHITDFSNATIACVGPATTAAVRAWGIQVDVQPAQFTSEGLLESFAQHDLFDKRILLPRAKVARSILPETLRAMDAQVDVVATYRKETVPMDQKIWCKLNALALDGVLFCASSAVIALESWIDPAEETRFKHSVPAFCIGPSTRQTALSVNYEQVFTAAEQTLSGLVDSIIRHVGAPGQLGSIRK